MYQLRTRKDLGETMPLRIFLLIASLVGWPVAKYLARNFVGLFNEDSFGMKHFMAKAKEDVNKRKEVIPADELEDFLKKLRRGTETGRISVNLLNKPGNKLGQDL